MTADVQARLAWITARAADALGSEERAARWLHKENRALAGVRPVDLVATDEGAARIVQILGAIEHGIVL